MCKSLLKIFGESLSPDIFHDQLTSGNSGFPACVILSSRQFGSIKPPYDISHHGNHFSYGIEIKIIRHRDGTYFLYGKGKAAREYAGQISVDRVKRYLLLWNAVTEHKNEFGPLLGT